MRFPTIRFSTQLTNSTLELTKAAQSQKSCVTGSSLTTATKAMTSTQNTYPAVQKESISQDQQQGGDGMRNGNLRPMKYVLGLAATAYAYDRVTNHFFLSTTSLHDGKQGFTSNERLDKATNEAKEHIQRYEQFDSNRQAQDLRPNVMIRRVGCNQFLTMSDYRSATRIYLSKMVDTKQSHQSVATSLACLKGERIKAENIARYQPAFIPKDPDLTKSPLYDSKGKYSLSGVPNKESGSTGYASRSIMHPFVLKCYADFQKTCDEKGLSPRQCVNELEARLAESTTLDEKTQLIAGKAILNLRQVYAHDQYWGHAEKVIMKMLSIHGLLSSEEALKLDQSLMFEDPDKSLLTRNTSIMGPVLHKLETCFHQWRLKNDPKALEDMKPMINSKNIENMPLAHFKVNDKFDGFEDSSGFGDSFTCANAAACINHARLMSSENSMSKSDVIALIGSINSVYADASGIRHSLQEVARGCFVGAGYTIDDADNFYEKTCKAAAHAFYNGKSV
ncbi:XopAG/AvrGf1 family type III secretion system effector [Erwinia psidii]|uniref:XopAG/AvrGf1 family type III secretion system effector n=1 Tax=Erwinia psidii TaxID=69224 RepID=UPI002B49669D|nr:XopAG/AvrGf1 family type III secretion system effector [Erwinia psidii]